MNKKYYLIIGVLVVALLAGGAFMSMRLLNPTAQGSTEPGIGWLEAITQLGGGGNKRAAPARLIRAPELPRQAADLRGQVVSVKDNSVFVAQMDNFVVHNNNGVIQQDPTPVGPYTEVVVSKGTRIWRDVTNAAVAGPSGNTTTVQQQLEPSDLTAINSAATFVEVWGSRRGDRLSADMIVIYLP